MKTKSFILTMLLVLFVSAQANAQESKSDYIFKPHAYITLQGGAQYTLGEASFGDLISPNVQLGIGYQFVSWFGMRIAANAWQSKGGWNGYTEGNASAETVTYKYNYVAPGIDFMFDLTNAIGGFNPKRVVGVSLFVGGAANIAWGNDDAISLAAQGYDMRYLWTGTKVRAIGRGGIDIDFRVCDALSIGIEGNANVSNDRYNSKKAGSADWYFNALVGLKINLGKTYKKKAAPAPIEEPVPVVVEEPAPAPEPEPEPVVEEVKPLRVDVFFNINDSQILEQESGKVTQIADYMKANADSKVTITGYADAGTGNETINTRLGNERAKVVADELMEKYGIDESRITYSGKGDTEQPFPVNDKNRVSICIAE